MTVSEFINKNKHIIGEQMSPDEINALRVGEVVYAITAYKNANKPFVDCTIRKAGYCMICASYNQHTPDGKPFFRKKALTLTSNGYAEIVDVSYSEAYVNQLRICRCHPAPASDGTQGFLSVK